MEINWQFNLFNKIEIFSNKNKQTNYIQVLLTKNVKIF